MFLAGNDNFDDLELGLSQHFGIFSFLYLFFFFFFFLYLSIK